ncbi:hypothetical protein [Candidatus Frankia alpina]|nr:hypothetical protein [Candidatus Frankia alpina]
MREHRELFIGGRLMGASGLGREGGPEGISAFVELQSIVRPGG